MRSQLSVACRGAVKQSKYMLSLFSGIDWPHSSELLEPPEEVDKNALRLSAPRPGHSLPILLKFFSLGEANAGLSRRGALESSLKSSHEFGDRSPPSVSA